MYSCPHCRTAAISLFDKWWSCAAMPCTCRSCSGLSYVRNATSNAIFCLAAAMFVVTIAVAVSAGSAEVALAGFGLTICSYWWLWHRAHLHPTFPGKANASAALSWGMLIIYALLALNS